MHVILYVLDALRADHLGCYGYARPTSPAIDALARDGAVFERCYTPATWTRPVAASILTGVYPAVHRARRRDEVLAVDITHLPEVLREAGFRTCAFCAMGNLAGRMGFSRGFDEYRDLFRDPDIIAKRPHADGRDELMMLDDGRDIALPTAEDINNRLLPWIEDNRDRDTFSFVWSVDTHIPYSAPNEFRIFCGNAAAGRRVTRSDLRGAGPGDRRCLVDSYDEEVLHADHCIGTLVGRLRSLDVYDSTLLLITSDHGEAFHEHHVYGHGHAPYEEVARVPLVVKSVSSAHAGSRIDALVELLDIFPTVLAAAGCRPDEKLGSQLQGHSLLPLLAGETAMVREHVFSDTQALAVHNRYLSVRLGNWKYMKAVPPDRSGAGLLDTVRHVLKQRLMLRIIRRPRHFLMNYFRRDRSVLFDLESDPEEKNDVSHRHPDVRDRLAAALAEWVRDNEKIAHDVPVTAPVCEEDEEVKRQLKKLGYL